MDIKDIPEDLLSTVDHWIRGSFEETIENMDDWIAYAMEIIYTKNKSTIALDDIKSQIRSGKLNSERIIDYGELMEESGERDNRYLHPIYLSVYFVARARAIQLYKEGNYEKAMSALCSLAFHAGAMYENSQLSRAGAPTYISDPMRVKIASEAAEATHAGTKKVQRMVREIILSDKPSAGWRSKKAAATHIENVLLEKLYNPSDDTSSNPFKPKQDLGFTLNLKATALHDRILKWMGAGSEGVKDINIAINSTLKRKN